MTDTPDILYDNQLWPAERRAREYRWAATALRELADVYVDRQVRATLAIQAAELDATAERWEREPK